MKEREPGAATTDPERPRGTTPTTSGHPLLDLQRAAGNTAVTHLLARSAGTVDHAISPASDRRTEEVGDDGGHTFANAVQESMAPSPFFGSEAIARMMATTSAAPALAAESTASTATNGTGATSTKPPATPDGGAVAQPDRTAAIRQQVDSTVPGWKEGQRAALASAIRDGGSARPDDVWFALASALARDGKAELVAQFAMDRAWDDERVVELATERGNASGVARKVDWLALGAAHAGLHGNVTGIAALARLEWSPADAALLLASLTADQAAALVAEPAICAVGQVFVKEAGADAGPFLAAALAADATCAELAALVGVNGIGAGLKRILALHWTTLTAGNFAGAALGTGADADRVGSLLKSQDFAREGASALHRAPDAKALGTACGGYLLGGASNGQVLEHLRDRRTAPGIERLIGTVFDASAVQAFTVAAKGCGRLEDFGVLVARPAVRAGFEALGRDGWTAAEVVDLVHALRSGGVAVKRTGGLIEDPSFAKVREVTGKRGADLGAIIGGAVKSGGPLEAVVSVLSGAGSGAAIAALPDPPAEVGGLLGRLLGPPNPFASDDVTSLLKLAAKRGVRVSTLRDVAGATKDMKGLLQQALRFDAVWVGPRARGGQEPLHTVPLGSAADPFSLSVTLERWAHVEQGHTFEFHDFTPGNIDRNGGRSATFFPAGTDVKQLLVDLVNDAHVQAQAHLARTGSGQLSVRGKCVGLDPAKDGTARVLIMQCYPESDLKIDPTTLKAIGRLFGQPTA